MGYKIEKYLDNSATQPIQTYYTNDAIFFDTQLKYGRRYIYKTKVLLGILGSSYSYSNLFVSQNETQMFNSNGEQAPNHPAQFVEISSEKYRAYVDVEVSPSFKILEYEIDVDEVAFVDAPTLPPQVDMFNQKNKPTIDMRFSPIFAKVESVSAGTNKELMRALEPLTEADQKDLKSIGDLQRTMESRRITLLESTKSTERERLHKKSVGLSANSYLTTVDDTSGLSFPISMNLPESQLNNMEGFFEDSPIINEKYYYAFRALTYHGTPSNLTVPYQVELMRDSDEYKVDRYPNITTQNLARPMT